jgi:hypothetical protein
LPEEDLDLISGCGFFGERLGDAQSLPEDELDLPSCKFVGDKFPDDWRRKTLPEDGLDPPDSGSCKATDFASFARASFVLGS